MGSDGSSAVKGNPSERLSQVVNHLSPSNPPNTGRKQRKSRSKADELPADYSDILTQLDSLRTIASTPNLKNTGYVRQKQAGKLWVRERVEQLLDKGSFREVGSVSGTVEWKKLSGIREEPVSFIPSNNVQSFGTLRGRKIVFTADDSVSELDMQTEH
jgi:acetyl-CoA carboxylase carboxyltransferase component